MTDVNWQQPASLLIHPLPTNDQDTVATAAWRRARSLDSFLTPFFDGAQYKSGDTAVFFPVGRGQTDSERP